jgi:hypothetical protein
MEVIQAYQCLWVEVSMQPEKEDRISRRVFVTECKVAEIGDLACILYHWQDRLISII